MIKNNKTLVYIWMAILVACVLLIILKGKIASGLEAFSLTNDIIGKHSQGFQTSRNIMSRLMVITIENDTQQNLATSSKALKNSLKKSAYFEFVTNGQHDAQNKQNDILFKYRYLLSDRFDTRQLDSEQLKRALEALVPKTFSHFYSFSKNRLLADPTLESDYLARRYHAKSDMKMAYGVWFNSAADSAIILAYLKQDIRSDDDRQALMQQFTQEFHQSKSSQQQIIRFTGPATFSVISRNIIKSEVRFLSLTGSLLIVLLLYFAFRRKRVMLLVALPVVTAILVASTITILVFGNIHGITLAFGITLLGICIDYPIHLFAHAREDEHIDDTIRSLWPVIRLGVLTTLIGFVLMMFSGLPGLVQLGLFSLGGIVAAALTTRWVLPLLVNDVQLIQQHGLFSMPHRKKPPVVLIYAITVGIAISALWMFTNISGSLVATRLASLNPVPKSDLLRYERLRNDIGLPQAYQYIAVSGDSIESVLREEERIISDLRLANKNQSGDGYIHVSRYLPSVHAQNRRKAALPDKAGIGKMLEYLLPKLPFKDSAFTQFVDDVDQSRFLKPLEFEDMSKTFLGPYISSLLFATDDGWTGLIFVDKETGLDSHSNILQAKYATHVRYYNLKDKTELLFNNLRDSIIDNIQIASVVILLVLFAGLRSFSKLVKVALPILMTIVLTMLVVYYLQGPLTIFHLIALILVFGICVDYSLFFNSNNEDGAYRRTFHAISVCALSTLAVFGLLVVSDIVVLKSIGFTVATGTILAYLMSYFYSTRPA